MSNVLFIHSSGPQGVNEGSGGLVAALRSGLPKSFTLSVPIMPSPDEPDAMAWLKAFGEHVADLRAPFVLVGHSLGGSVILQYLAEHDAPAGLTGVVLIAAPFWGTQGWEKEWALPADFEVRLSKLPRLVLYQSADDDVVPPSHLERYAEALPGALIRRVDGRGHLFDGGNVEDIIADICA